MSEQRFAQKAPAVFSKPPGQLPPSTAKVTLRHFAAATEVKSSGCSSNSSRLAAKIRIMVALQLSAVGASLGRGVSVILEGCWRIAGDTLVHLVIALPYKHNQGPETMMRNSSNAVICWCILVVGSEGPAKVDLEESGHIIIQ